MNARLRVTVDLDLCVGNAMCRAIAPEAFTETADGRSTASDPGSATSDAVMEAAASCPVAAIAVRNAETNELVEF